MLAALAACSRPLLPLPQDVYVWQRVWTPAVGEALRVAAGSVRSWRILAAELDGQGAWREQFADADLMTDPAVADAALEAAKAQPTTIVEPYLIDVRIEESGAPVPISFRERVRALGPTIHPDMGKQVAGGPVIAAITAAHGAARSTGRVALIRRK